MKFHYTECMTAVTNYVPLARAAEECGFSGFIIPDSIIFPLYSNSMYSYTNDGSRDFLENKPFVESFVLAATIGAVTSRLELTTNVVKLPVRPPVYVAKLASSIAAITGDRFNLGVGLSVWPEDYAAMGVDYARRGKRFDECLAIVQGLCAGDYFEFHGEFYDFEPIKLNPVPDKPLPILIGGHSNAALDRAARHDGFMFASGDVATLAPAIVRMNEARERAGMLGRDFRIFSTTMGDSSLDAVRRLEDLGVTDLSVAFRNLYAVEEDAQTLQQKLDKMFRFSESVISRL